MSRWHRRAVLGALAGALGGCVAPGGEGAPTATDGQDATPTTEAHMGELQVTSPAFADGEPIPERYGKRYDNVNPPLEIAGVPDGAASLAVVVDDPDAPGGVFDHWLVWNVPPESTAIPADWDPPAGVVQGTNDFGNVGYDGPRPPEKHTYRFTVHALDATVDLERGAETAALADAMEGHELASGLLTGTFAP